MAIMLNEILVLILAWSILCTAKHELDGGSRPNWLINVPPEFERRPNNTNMKRFELSDVQAETSLLAHVGNIVDERLKHVDGFTDGEFVDVIEHFFWGKAGGISVELGALDGSWRTKSQTEELEKFGWKRILIDGNPAYRQTMPKYSPNAFCVLAAICADDGSNRVVHFQPREYTGGILEFMGKDFLKDYHKEIYEASNPRGDVSSIDWSSSSIQKLGILPIDCVPLHVIFRRAHVQHINFFILDVEGGEFEVLQSISWSHTSFDVLCIETEKANRPEGLEAKISTFLRDKGYLVYGHIGRNSWYVRSDFVPAPRPGVPKDCFNGARKSAHEDSNWVHKRRDKFVRCETKGTTG